jgi:oxygen-dependent protoporphyrinogen oxidase
MMSRHDADICSSHMYPWQIKSLGISSQLICVPKSHPSAKNRFLYYAGKIHLLPSSIGKALRTLMLDRSHPLSKGNIPSTIFRGLFKPKEKRQKGSKWADESIESFLTRRLGKKDSSSLPLLDYVGSAVLHGIYAADASKLSVRSIFGFLWNANVVHGSPARAMIPSFLNMQHTSLEKLANTEGDESARLELNKSQRLEKELEKVKERLGAEYIKEMGDVSVVSFPDGIQTLTNAMTKECEERGVMIKTGAKVEAIDISKDDQVTVSGKY